LEGGKLEDEVQYFHSGRIAVTSSRINIGNTVYFLAQINTIKKTFTPQQLVSPPVEADNPKPFGIVLLAFSCVCFIGLYFLFTEIYWLHYTLWLIALALTAISSMIIGVTLAFARATQAKPAVYRASFYSLVFNTSAGDQAVLSSGDERSIDDKIAAISKAIAARMRPGIPSG
jgi:hypothetical protein